MRTPTTPIKYGIALAGAVVAIAAPGASARPAYDRHIPASALGSRSQASEITRSPSLASLAADREAKAAKSWRTANRAPVITVTRPDGGFDLVSAGIGAAVALALVMAESGGVWAVRRRRANRVRHQLT